MSYQFYLFLHLVSLFITFLILGGVITHVLSGGTKQNFELRKSFAMIHGITVLIAFVSGFGLMAKAQYSFGTSTWLYGKILCWLLVGAFPAIVYKKLLPRWGDLALLIVVATAAITLVVFKPI
ncbi:MAG: hypothetical protein IT287_06025 [Bdellovibrionaceae bacterium]|nr:hypothetical protein [Pseudobdellovibrionaceae bacterium]